eukprot:13743369-Heterocapsa_arctica.AAC.1
MPFGNIDARCVRSSSACAQVSLTVTTRLTFSMSSASVHIAYAGATGSGMPGRAALRNSRRTHGEYMTRPTVRASASTPRAPGEKME